MVQASMRSREGASHKKKVFELQSSCCLRSITSAVLCQSNVAFNSRQIVAVDKLSTIRMRSTFSPYAIIRYEPFEFVKVS
jgi:hypothetical protein